MGAFTKATRQNIPLKIALAGPSGSGKTYSALRIAKGIGGKIAFLDTENGSASLYSNLAEFDVITISAPFTVQKYLDGIKAAQEEGYTTLIIDSMSHAWAGSGGLLEQKAKLDEKPGSNQYANWNKPTAEHEKFKEAILQCPINLIGCMRSKQEYALRQGENGSKGKVEKLGMAPIQREGMEYEFTLFFDIDMTHNALGSKDRTGIYDQKNLMLTEEVGKALVAWRNSGAEPVEVKKEVPPATKEKPENVLVGKISDILYKLILPKEEQNLVYDKNLTAEIIAKHKSAITAKLSAWALVATKKGDVFTMKGLTVDELTAILAEAEAEVKRVCTL